MLNLKKVISTLVPKRIESILRAPLRARSIEKQLLLSEKELLDLYGGDGSSELEPIFIIASPRTGSTFVYQVLCKYLNVTYFPNSAEVLCGTPLLSWLVSRPIVEYQKNSIACRNEYGVSEGGAGPSEASSIFRNWFPCLHPSEIESKDFISFAAMQNMVQVFASIHKLGGRPLITKNAWNCFRLEAIVKVFPEAKFIYLQRDIVDCSYSTLRARKKQGDPRTIWNSASPANVAEIRKLPYYVQVVEQQYQTNEVVKRFFDKAGSVFYVQYEDFISQPERLIAEIGRFANVDLSQSIENVKSDVRPPKGGGEEVSRDRELIAAYCKKMGYL